MLACVLLGLAQLLLPLQAGAAVEHQRWNLTDPQGSRWGLTLFEQPDPAYPAGWRLRLQARSPGQTVDHHRPLQLSDGLGGTWTLPNRSEELVPPGDGTIPAASGQFDAGELTPRPSDVLPLRLEVPSSDLSNSVPLMLPPEVVQTLHRLPESGAG